MATIFVFGSNLAGRHGKGAAKEAREKWGATYGQGEGRQGDAYAIPTKDEQLRSRTWLSIQESVGRFVEYARGHPDDQFIVTAVGCGLAGYDPEDIAPMFRNAPKNCELPAGWWDIIHAE